MSGYNCAQSLAGAFADVTALDQETILRLASSFGGGMGKLREVCGACTGAFMILGLREGYSDPADEAAKARQYARVQAFAKRFKEMKGSYICRDLLGSLADQNADTPAPSRRTAAYYAERPCLGLLVCAANLLDEMLAEKK